MRVLEDFKDFDRSVEYRCGKCGKKFYLQRLARQCFMSHSYGSDPLKVKIIIPFVIIPFVLGAFFGALLVTLLVMP